MIITDQPNIFVNFGGHPSLYPKSHHQIVLGTINLSVPRPPPYKLTVWKYDKAEIGMINSELRSINWSDRFDELDVDQAVDSFTNCFMSVITQHILNRELLVATGTHLGSQMKLRKLFNVNIVSIENMSNEVENLMTGCTLNKLKLIRLK